MQIYQETNTRRTDPAFSIKIVVEAPREHDRQPGALRQSAGSPSGYPIYIFFNNSFAFSQSFAASVNSIILLQLAAGS